MTPLWIILTWLFAIFGKQIWDYYQIERLQKSPPHGKELVFMTALAALHLTISGIWGNGWLFAIMLVLFDFCAYVALFDGGLNKMRGKAWLYIGWNSRIDKDYWQGHRHQYELSKVISSLVAFATGVILFFL